METAVELHRALGDDVGLYLALCTVCLSVAGGDAQRQQDALGEMKSLERSDWPARHKCWGALAQARLEMNANRVAPALAAYRRALMMSEVAGDSASQHLALIEVTKLELAAGHFDNAAGHGGR
jgi:hypothetical protein